MMTHANHEVHVSNKRRSPRSSGRVGIRAQHRSMAGFPSMPSSITDVIGIYRHLLSILSQEESELTKAIAYGLKILDGDYDRRDTKSKFRRLFERHS